MCPAISPSPRRPTLPETPLSRIGASLASRPYALRGAPATNRLVRLLLVDDQSISRAGLYAVLREATDVEIAGEVADFAQALAALPRYQPDVIILQCGARGEDGLQLTRALAAEASLKVLVLCALAEEEWLLPFLEAGASGYLTTDASVKELHDAIRIVASGEVFVLPRVARLLATQQRTRARSPRDGQRLSFDRLSPRERAVVELLAQGFAGVEIGQRLGISHKTVETYKARIADKLGFRHRSDYVRFALDVGLLQR